MPAALCTGSAMQLQRRSPVTAAAPAAAAQRLVAPAAAAAPQHAASLRCSLRSTFPGGASISSVAALRTSAGRRSLHVAGAVGPNEKRAQIQQQRLDSLSKIDVLFDEELKALDTNLVKELVADDFKEQDRKKLRVVFDFDRWQRHRSSSRYLRHMTGLFTSRTLKWMGAPLVCTLSVATAVGIYYTAAEMGMVPDIPDIKTNAVFGLTSFALANLLVLTTNTAYQRFDEARKMWGLIVNRSRDMTRQGLAYIPEDQPELQEMFCRWVVAYSRSLMCHLRAGENLERELLGKLPESELRALLTATHRPNFTNQVIAQILKRADLPGAEVKPWDSTANVKASAFVRMDEHLTVFADVTGGCERILRTPVPLMYSRHTSRMLTIWLSFLPFSLWDACHWWTVPVTGLVAYLLLGIKEIGLTVEEPFSILPLEKICDTIESNVWELHSTHSAQGAAASRRRSAATRDATQSMDAEDLVSIAAAVDAGAMPAPAQ
ncbi:UPF0187 chloroplastic [Micractinium conductrix]|uniref:UPF0187 chloroplastic n=1 Tax=Micractinium conductrix TaxID=554055 RepID=A0A2P6V017_9CHLO|nr:UPF0187 chloroplastic [Micractinium conductrix]|eukprot:PSC67432.1 UPF0187 chloroplastic [Micractinium conductrix]